MQLPKVSIIVPIYNGEDKLESCIQSVLKQTYQEWELILVNDGSKDHSLEICQNYANMYESIIVIDKENGGVSSARNYGLREAKGEYIQFIDCDDYVESDYLEVLVREIEQKNADLVISGYTRHKNGKISRNVPSSYVSDGVQQFSQIFFLLYNRWLINIPWNKLFRKNLIKSDFPGELSLGEDLIFNLNYLQQCKRIAIVDCSGYHYCIENGNSLAFQFREDRFENSCYLHRQVFQFATEYLLIKEDLCFDQSFIRQIRFSIVSMVKSSNISKIEKQKLINKWINREDVREAYQKKGKMSIVDFMLKKLILNRKCKLIYLITSLL